MTLTGKKHTESGAELNDAIKKRLIGAIMLGCLAIIFIPMLLDGEGLKSPELVIEMPVAPLIPAVPDIQPVRPDFAVQEDQLRASAIEAELAATSSVQTDQPEDYNGPALDEDGLPEGWVVRMGAFAERANAQALEQRLRALDHKAFTRPLTTSQGILTAVYVGPVIDRREAERLQSVLNDAIAIQGVITEFTIDD